MGCYGYIDKDEIVFEALVHCYACGKHLLLTEEHNECRNENGEIPFDIDFTGDYRQR